MDLLFLKLHFLKYVRDLHKHHIARFSAGKIVMSIWQN